VRNSDEGTDTLVPVLYKYVYYEPSMDLVFGQCG
jgi:hypothetical protein